MMVYIGKTESKPSPAQPSRSDNKFHVDIERKDLGKSPMLKENIIKASIFSYDHNEKRVQGLSQST